MSSISGFGPAGGPPNLQVQGQGARPAQTPANGDAAKVAGGPSDTDDTKGVRDPATEALVNPGLSNAQAKSLSAEIGQQLAGQSLSIANRSPQALQTAFAG